ncbi:bifunctional hydroxymethylpyrimidine kinase/phosphomethylpyrimidine kinase [Actinoplanes subtropicus]|uniref:bifunctional hydroxymethylpyrimidine kinase/phosphomethylpyrimidine kinase n=1 Tax=Actinoplanes subtropicus TaxID=543632 RepID=UPI0004C44E68|nr:bifunctional hydroxymethylpyrimidine kinase/phosphomethylpyrimidine kinase [Actinoplanes subtropicus]
MSPPVVLTIAGSDSGGGAGIQADLKTFAALGAYGTSVITAITAQNTLGVTAIHPVPIDIVAAQLDAVLADFEVAAVKVGMIGDRAVAELIRERGDRLANLVVDPVLVATSGARLGAAASVAPLLAYGKSILTPNRAEAAALSGRPVETPEDMVAAAMQLAAGRNEGGQRDRAGLHDGDGVRDGGGLRDRGGARDERDLRDSGGARDERDLRDGGGARDERDLRAGGGARAVVVTGSELAVDVLWHDGETALLRGEPVDTRNNHGSGCTFSAALAVRLAFGDSVPEAVSAAKKYVTSALRGGRDWRLGAGPGPLNHFA